MRSDSTETSTSLVEDDVFLGSTTSFSNSNTLATISSVSIPAGNDQRLLVLIDLGQRLETSSDTPVSIRLNSVSASNSVISGLVVNPIVPSTYNVHEHLLGLKQVVVSNIDSSSTELI